VRIFHYGLATAELQSRFENSAGECGDCLYRLLRNIHVELWGQPALECGREAAALPPAHGPHESRAESGTFAAALQKRLRRTTEFRALA